MLRWNLNYTAPKDENRNKETNYLVRLSSCSQIVCLGVIDLYYNRI